MRRALLLFAAVCAARQLGPGARPAGPRRADWRALVLRGGDSDGIETLENQRQLDDALAAAGDQLVVVDFFAEWCGPCKAIAPVLESLAKSARNVAFYKVEVDSSRELATAYEVKSMPTILFFRRAELVDTIVGADEVKLRSLVAQATQPRALRAVQSPRAIAIALAAYVGWSWWLSAR